jgi:outer membrane protein TolC
MKRTLYYSVFAVLAFGGCSTITQEESFKTLKTKTAHEELVWIKSAAEAESVQKSVDEILNSPLSEENAVRIALLNNRNLQQTYEEIGISQSELVQAGLMSNPILGYSVGRQGGVNTSTVGIEFAFLDLLWIPLRRELGGLALEETRLRVGDIVHKTVRDTKIAYIDAQTTQIKVALAEEWLKSAEVSAQLAARQNTAGNLSKRDFVKIWDEYAHIRIEVTALRQEASSARERLNRILGLYALQTQYRLARIDSALVAMKEPVENLEAQAVSSRLDIAAAKKRVEYAAKEAGYTENTRLLDSITLSAEREKSSLDPTKKSYGIAIPIPIFDMGQGRLGTAQARYNQSVHRLYEMAVSIRSEVRESYANAKYAYDIAYDYRESVLTNNQTILQESGKYYNGMLDGVYELLQDQRHLAEARIETANAIGHYQKRLSELEYVVGINMEGGK